MHSSGRLTGITFAVSMALALPARAEILTIPHTFSPNTPALSAQVNANFNALKGQLDRVSSNKVHWVTNVSQLEDALATVAPGLAKDTTVIILAPGRYELSGTVNIDGNVALIGLMLSTHDSSSGLFGAVAILAADTGQPIFDISADSNVLFDSVLVSLEGGTSMTAVTCDLPAGYGRVVLQRSYIGQEINNCSVYMRDSMATVRIDNAPGSLMSPRVDIRENSFGVLYVRNTDSVDIDGAKGAVLEITRDDPDTRRVVNIRNTSSVSGSITGNLDTIVVNSQLGGLTATGNAAGAPFFLCRSNYDGYFADIACP